ncbi:DNA/RNA nuclease SfsA [Desulfobulbus alkaliphilus]|uniref:DNA/RNA nuclease SfsA n=1 Tax=Desulfobulbus alkaliphilus TaxID=869814 RepID=UPI0019655AC1|nr:DNA/RNA nuclease SfsA [Desulfobulbus alkaliphilus]MBM9536592.1 DNA/RNA nuclease SfsA [Desulfobulbus alkaliphilus]
MLLPPDRQNGILLKRYKRFLADVRMETGRTLTVHCPNSGSMRGCAEPGSPVIISHSANPRRKYPWTLEMVQHNGIWIGVNTGRTNGLVREALEQGVINDFGTITALTAEITVSGQSRLDFLIESSTGSTYLEVKNCSLVEEQIAFFPDAITIRGTRHLMELAALRSAGHGAVVLFCIQRQDARCFKPAAHIDRKYAETVAWAQGKGVQFLAYQAEVTPRAIKITRKIPVHLE